MTLHDGGVVSRELRCPNPKCNRFLSMTTLPLDVGPGRAYARVQCRSCNCWRWLDLVTGKERT